MTPGPSASPAASHACVEHGHLQVCRDFATAQTYVQQTLFKTMPLIVVVISSSSTSGKLSKGMYLIEGRGIQPYTGNLSLYEASPMNLIGSCSIPCKYS